MNPYLTGVGPFAHSFICVVSIDITHLSHMTFNHRLLSAQSGQIHTDEAKVVTPGVLITLCSITVGLYKVISLPLTNQYN